MAPEHTPNPTAMVQLYRGELSRLTAYRVRLDTTTNWALGATVAVVTFTLGKQATPHVVLLLPYVLITVFAVLESRRFQELGAIRARVRLLEQGFFAAELGATPPVGWERALADKLADRAPPMDFRTALSIRVRRNYLWLMLALYGSWWLKLGLSGVPWREAAAVGPLPPAVVLTLSALLLLPWFLVAAQATDDRFAPGPGPRRP